MKKRPPPGIAMTPQKRNGPPSDATGSNGNDVLSTKGPPETQRNQSKGSQRDSHASLRQRPCNKGHPFNAKTELVAVNA